MDARAGPRGQGHVIVHAQRENEAAAIVVEDDGPGVAEGASERIFDPYFTSKRQGTGLGLAIVKKIVVEHNGSITAGRSERLGGAEFAVRLPLPGSPAQGDRADGRLARRRRPLRRRGAHLGDLARRSVV